MVVVVRYNMVVQQEEEPFPDDEAVVVGVNSFGIGVSQPATGRPCVVCL